MILDAVTRLIPGALGNENSAVNESFSEIEPRARAKHDSGVTGHESRFTIHESRFTDHDSRITSHGILDFPHYTRPQSFRGWDVPEILVSGNHEEIHLWRRKKALEKTARNRPDLLDAASDPVQKKS